MTGRPGAPRVLHLFGSLAASDPLAARAVRLANGLGGRLRHGFVADDGIWTALDELEKGIPAERVERFPGLGGLPTPGRLQTIARAMLDYHLVLTYGRRGAYAAMAHTMFSEVHALPPLIHHEDGSDETAAQRKGWRSRWVRRVGLGKAAGLVVPGETMEAAALEEWQQPLGRVKVIRDGVDLDLLARKSGRDALPRLRKRAGERWIVAFAVPGEHRSVAAVVRALAKLDPRWHLVVAAEGEDRAAALTEAASSQVEDRLHVVAQSTDRATLLGLADLFAIADGREPVPFAALEAMGAGLAIVGVATAELATELGRDNADHLGRPGDAKDLEEGIVRLAGDDYLRKTIGAANREKAIAERGREPMVSAYRRLYASAMGREQL